MQRYDRNLGRWHPVGPPASREEVRAQLRTELRGLHMVCRSLPYEMRRHVRSMWYQANGARVRYARGV